MLDIEALITTLLLVTTTVLSLCLAAVVGIEVAFTTAGVVFKTSGSQRTRTNLVLVKEIHIRTATFHQIIYRRVFVQVQTTP
jgi:hypothetical protein